jgi:hypothetical protein
MIGLVATQRNVNLRRKVNVKNASDIYLLGKCQKRHYAWVTKWITPWLNIYLP